MKTIVIGRFVATSAILLLGPLGCSAQNGVQGESREPAVEVSNAAFPIQPSGFEERMLEIARSYKTYGRLGEQVRMTYQLCQPALSGLLGATPKPSAPMRLSASGDSATHGRKLYWLYVKDLPAQFTGGDYTPAEGPNPVGQVVVKEAWQPVEAKADDNTGAEKVQHVSDRDGRVYRPGRQADLFIMYKLEPKTPGTDEGWIYGTVTPDGKQVTCAGRVENCMGCHRDAPHDRLFGLAKK